MKDSGNLHAPWVDREWGRAGCTSLGRIRVSFTNHVIGLEWPAPPAAQGTGFVILSHRETLAAAPVLVAGRDELAAALDWLRPDFRCCPAVWDEAVDILRMVGGEAGRAELRHLLNGVHLLVEGSEDDLARLDAALRLMLGDGPAKPDSTILRKRDFLTLWEPFLRERGLVGG